jgi:type II secretory pathway pseudopilin PulG
MKFITLRNESGFSFIEVIIVIAIIIMLVAMASTSFTPVRSKTSLDTVIVSLLAELKSQQIKAMTGDTERTGVNSDYGVYFENDRYVIFRGSAYSPSDPSNFAITIGEPIEFSTIALPSSSVVFTQKQGDISGFSASNNSITLTDTSTGNQKTIFLNKHGVIYQIN